MSKGRERHMFPGGNTSKGFFSYYDFVLPQEQAKRIFILKGGPGVGKSSFMKKIAADMIEKGFDAEFMHCSSDPNSLDGVVFPDIHTAILDGTSPHIVDPKNPGAVDEIINLGEFWNEERFIPHRDEILKTNGEIGRVFARAYRYINAAYSIYQDNETIHGWAMDHGKANVSIADAIEKIFTGIDVSEVVGKQRHLFASAITPDGLVNYLPTLINTEEIIEIIGKPGTGTERLLERVRVAAVDRGLYTESYYCALNPHKLEHLIIPELNVSITTRNDIHHIEREPTQVVNFDDYLDQAFLSGYQEIVRFNLEEFEKLLNKAVETIKQAKALHDELETYYIPNMNFDEVSKCRESVLRRLLSALPAHDNNPGRHSLSRNAPC